ncbi:NAD-dependent epimerase/dehydratase family protein [Aeromicrobium sp. Leaf350]|uniref:NAD-dependent epimerase/dehydratase family protein n=1 Tax=Aeromicrobium sp. Leaf350 TaxID=2876565 RepID=UPI001E6550E2|nr:NAD-dependent epimerase/dehydratase family protein [Aeromicrobium sp. Leaf350]
MSHALLIGAGDLGSDVGLRLATLGHEVTAVRRRGDLVSAPMRGISADLTREAPDLAGLAVDLLVVALTARPRSEEAYRATYVDGMTRALDALTATGQVPVRSVLVSSTGVYGDAGPETVLDEDSPAVPGDAPARVLLEAEQTFHERLPSGTVLRLSGLYRGEGGRLVDQVRNGTFDDPHRWTNRIHRDDAAAAVVHLLTRAEQPGPLYVGTDDEPSLMGDVAAHVARQLDLPAPPAAEAARGHGKRLSNARLRASGWRPVHPTYREGYVLHP